MRVLRIELKGEGVFSGDPSAVSQAVRLAAEKRGVAWWAEVQETQGKFSPYRHPPPWDDVPDWARVHDRDSSRAYKFFCGFHSQEQLLAWFDSEAVRSAMNEIGCEVITFEIDEDDVFLGKAQVMFLKEAAIETGRSPLPTLA